MKSPFRQPVHNATSMAPGMTAHIMDGSRASHWPFPALFDCRPEARSIPVLPIATQRIAGSDEMIFKKGGQYARVHAHTFACGHGAKRCEPKSGTCTARRAAHQKCAICA